MSIRIQAEDFDVSAEIDAGGFFVLNPMAGPQGSSTLNNSGTLTNGATWTGSTAYLGDRSVHLVASPDGRASINATTSPWLPPAVPRL